MKWPKKVNTVPQLATAVCTITITKVLRDIFLTIDPPGGSDAVENLTVDFVLETELRPVSGAVVTSSAQRELVYSLDDLYTVLFDLVSDGEMTWSTRGGSQVVGVSLDSALSQFDMDNCSAGQILNDRDPDVPTCRKWHLFHLFCNKAPKMPNLLESK